MKSVDKIHIENIKGIENETFLFSLIPYMPTFLVAPNGFGKSSIATAFNSLNRDRLKLDVTCSPWYVQAKLDWNWKFIELHFDDLYFDILEENKGVFEKLIVEKLTTKEIFDFLDSELTKRRK